MNITEVLRQQTLSARDKITGLDLNIVQAEAMRAAAEERVKRAGTDITHQRKLEAERKRTLNLIADKVSDAQRILDELERKRQEALEGLMRLQDEHTTIARSLRDAQAATEGALAEIRKEQKIKQDAESDLARARDDRKDGLLALHRALLKGLDSHLEQQAAIIQAAFSTQEQQIKAIREIEALKKARHTDHEVGKLCDERDEIRKLLRDAMVPGVKAMLQSSLRQIEDTLAKRFPTALRMADITQKDNRIEELLFYCDREGKAVFLLPISAEDWNAIDQVDISEGASKTMCVVWNMIRELGLRTKEGNFSVVRDRAVFRSKFDLEVIATHSFSVKREGAEVIRFVLTAVPIELQEALFHEDQDN